MVISCHHHPSISHNYFLPSSPSCRKCRWMEIIILLNLKVFCPASSWRSMKMENNNNNNKQTWKESKTKHSNVRPGAPLPPPTDSLRVLIAIVSAFHLRLYTLLNPRLLLLLAVNAARLHLVCVCVCVYCMMCVTGCVSTSTSLSLTTVCFLSSSCYHIITAVLQVTLRDFGQTGSYDHSVSHRLVARLCRRLENVDFSISIHRKSHQIITNDKVRSVHPSKWHVSLDYMVTDECQLCVSSSIYWDKSNKNEAF